MSVIHVTDQTFADKVLKAKKPVLVDFWAPWCGPCRMISPVLDQLAADLGGKATIAKMNVDENMMTPGYYGVQGIPTMKLFVGGQAVDTLVGVRPAEQLKAAIARYL